MFQTLLSHFGICPLINGEAMKTEWTLFKHTVCNDANLRQLSTTAMLKLLVIQDNGLSVAFPNLSVLAKLYLVLPVSTAGKIK